MQISLEQPDPSALPESPGIYSFQLNLVDLPMLGLRGNSNFAPSDLARAREKLVARLKWIKLIYEKKEFKGRMKSGEPNQSVSEKLSITAKTDLNLRLNSLEKRLGKINDLGNLIRVLQPINLLLPPLYVGMTISQGLKSRYWQHKSNYDSHVPGTFGGRIRSDGLLWSDVQFYCLPIPTELVEKEIIEFCEILLHGIGNPLYSYS